MAEKGLTPQAIRATVQEFGFEIKRELEDGGFHRWDLGREDFPAGFIVEVESSWIGHTGPPHGDWEDQFLKDLRVILDTLVKHDPPLCEKQWVYFHEPRPGDGDEGVYPHWRGPIDYPPRA